MQKPDPNLSLKGRSAADIISAINNDPGTPSDPNPGYNFLGDEQVVTTGQRMANGRMATAADAMASLHSIGEIVTNYNPNNNIFLNALVNRIGRVMITSRLYRNPLAELKKGMLEWGDTIEEIYINMAAPVKYDPANASDTVLKRTIPDVKAMFHTMNYKYYYPTTVSNDDLRQAFLSWEGVSDLISRIIEQVYTGANYDEFITTKYMIAKLYLNESIYRVNIPEVTATSARAVTSEMVSYARKMGFMSKKYNKMGVNTYTDISKMNILLTTDISSLFDVEVLALSFNMNKAELLGRQIYVDGFGIIDPERLAILFKDDPGYVPFTEEEIQKLNKLQALMVDENFFMMFDNYYNMTSIYIPNGLYWNYFYHVWKIMSVSLFSNAVAFTTEPAPTVTGVTIDPATATVAKSGTQQFTAEVTGTGDGYQAVTFHLTGNTSDNTTVTNDGLLTIAADEAATSLSVVVTSVVNPAKTATAVITIE